MEPNDGERNGPLLEMGAPVFAQSLRGTVCHRGSLEPECHDGPHATVTESYLKPFCNFLRTSSLPRFPSLELRPFCLLLPVQYVRIGAYIGELTTDTQSGPGGPDRTGVGGPRLSCSRVVEVPNGIASRRAEAPAPRACPVRGSPLAGMLMAALWSAFAVCPQAMHWNFACALRFSLLMCPQTAQVCEV